jgi:hypothetical protein
MASMADDRKILFQVDNPKKPKTRAYEQYEKYKKATTMREARELGATKKDLDFDRDHASWSSPVGEMISGFFWSEHLSGDLLITFIFSLTYGAMTWNKSSYSEQRLDLWQAVEK